MFIAGLTSGLAKGIEGQTRMAQLKEEKKRREEQFGMQKTEHDARMEQLTMQNKMMEMKFQELGQQMLRDGSYDNIKSWMSSPKDDKLQDEYLQATYVQNPTLNSQMAQRLKMNEIHDVTFDHDNARLQFKDNKTGQVVERPLDIFLAEIGYFTKADALAKKERTEAYDILKQKLDIQKTQTGIQKDQASINKSNLEMQQTYNDVKKAENVKQLSKRAKDIMESGDITQAIEYANALKNNPSVLNEIRKDKDTSDIVKLKGIENQLLNYQKKVESSEGIMDLVSQGKQAITKYLGSKGLTEQQKADALAAREIISEGTNIVAQYIKILSGAAFSTEELKQKVESVGLEFGVGKEAALASLKGLVTNIQDANSYGIGTLPYENAAYVTGVSARGEAKATPEAVDTKQPKVIKENKGFKVGQELDYKGTPISVTSVGPNGEITGYEKIEVIDASDVKTDHIAPRHMNEVREYFADIEAKGFDNPYEAYNKGSKAYGKYQITPIMMKELGLTKEELKDPEVQEQAFDEMIEDYTAGLERFNLPVTKETLFALHNLGRTGGLRLLRGTYKKSDIENMRNNIPGKDSEKAKLSDEEVVRAYKAKYNIKDS